MNLLKTIKGAGVSTTRRLSHKSPEILFAIGIVSFVGTVVAACMATKEEEEVLAEHADAMTEIRAKEEEGEITHEEARKETTRVYCGTVLKTARTYAPSVVMGVLSLGTLFGSHHIMRQRNAQLVSAYGALEAMYKKYRKGVVDRFGEEVDYDIAHGVREEVIEEAYTDSKGKWKEKKTTYKVHDGSPSMYTRYFTKSNNEWKGDDVLNEWFFNSVETAANGKLWGTYRHGYSFLCLNEVLDALGFEKTDYGMVVGWIYDKDHPVGDNKVEIRRQKVKVMNEYGELEDAFVLDFNVDGNIYEILRKRKEAA